MNPTVYTDPAGREAVSVEEQEQLGVRLEELCLEQERLRPIAEAQYEEMARQGHLDPGGYAKDFPEEYDRFQEVARELRRVRKAFEEGEEFFGKVATVVEESQGDLTVERLGQFIAEEENASEARTGRNIAVELLGPETCGGSAYCQLVAGYEGMGEAAAVLTRVVNTGVAVFGPGATADDVADLPALRSGAKALGDVATSPPEPRMVETVKLRFSQRFAGGRGGVRAERLRLSMRERGFDGDPIDVVETADGLVTIDND